MTIGRKKREAGTTLIEALVFLFVFSVVVLSFYSALSVGTRYIIEVKNRLGAAAIANERMEIVRNLDYGNIGTTAGIPKGVLSDEETISKNGRQYYVFVFVQYVDDPFDGTLSGTPKDIIPADYKRVRIKVAWENDIDTDKAVSVISNFSPKGIETSAGGGILSVNIINSKGTGIPQAEVNIKNAYSGIDMTTLTDDSGNIMLPGAPAGNRRYVITVSKDGYLSVNTMPAYPSTAYNPVDVNASVVANAVNTKSIITDRLSGFDLNFKDPFGTAVPNVSFDMKGGRVIGNAVSSPYAPVYAYNQTGLSSGTDGTKEFDNMSYGSFYLTIRSAGYSLINVNPGITSSNNVFDAASGSESDMDVVLADKGIGSLLVVVKNNKNSSVISGASVELSNSSGYDATVTSDQYGQAYFPTALPALTAGTYTLKVTASGFNDKSSAVTVGNILSNSEMKLIPR